jgi:hypothetical protein
MPVFIEVFSDAHIFRLSTPMIRNNQLNPEIYMKRIVKSMLAPVMGALAVLMLCASARADLVGGAYKTNVNVTSWVTDWAYLTNATFPAGLPPQYASIPSSSLGSASTAQGQPSAGGGATNTVLAETFTPAVSFSLRGIAILASANTPQVTVSMHLFDVTTNLTSNNGTIYNGSGANYIPTNIVDLLGNGNGLAFTMTTAGSGKQQLFFGLTNGPGSNDEIPLLTNHTYSLEFWTPTANQTGFLWYRTPDASVIDPGGQMMAGHDNATNLARTSITSAGLAGGAPRTASLALFSTNFINPGPTTNSITTVNNPVPTAYGPPTKWPYTAGIAIPADGTYTDQASGTNTVMGETFLPARDFNLRNFYFALSGSTNSGLYTLVLYNLGTGSLPTSFNPQNYVNLLSHPEAIFAQYWSFTPVNLTNKTIVKFKLGAGDQVTLSNANNYFLGFIYVPGSGSNDLVLERTTSSATYAHGAGYKGSSTNVDNNLGGIRNFIMAVDVFNPNLALSVSNSPLASGWPGSPTMATYDDPASLDDADLIRMSPLSGTALSMSFIATNNYNLGGVAFRQRGTGSSNVLFTLAVYEITNTYFNSTSSVVKWPRNFQPNLDTAPLGVPVFGTNLDFYYTTNFADLGTNDQILRLTINNPLYQVSITSNHNYAVEITAETLGQNAAVGGMFQVMRDLGSFFQAELFPDTGGGIGFRTNAASAGAYHNVLPRMLSRTFTDPETFAGGVTGGAEDARAMIMAVYAAPPTITISSVTHSGVNTVLTWNSSIGKTYSVFRTNNLAAPGASWPVIVTGYPLGGAVGTSLSYTDTTATAAVNFYRVSSP